MANMYWVLYYMPGTVQGTWHIFSFNPHPYFKVGATVTPNKGILLTNKKTKGQNVTFPEVMLRSEFR